MMAALLFGMTLAACGGKPAEPSSEAPQPSTSEVPQPSDSQEPQPSSSEAPQPSSSEAPQPSSSEAPQPSSSEEPPAPQGEMAANAIDIVEEGGKVYAKVGGTISGFANADAMKMAFGLKAESGTDYIYGSATPADADYKFAPTVDATAGTFELKVDLSDVTWVGGTYTVMVGPKGFYAAIPTTGGTYGLGQEIMNGFRISIRAHNGTLAADELPPVSMTISRIEVDEVNNKVYHVIGGALNTTKLSKEDFLAKHPYVNYECVVQWKTNVMGSSTKTDLVSVSVDEAGNALVKTDITSLPAESYNIKINLTEDKDVDTKMDVVIDGSENPVAFGMYDYVVYADSSKSGKDYIYGNCGLFIKNANRYVNAGEKFADLQPVKSKEGEIAYEMVAADCVGCNAPKASDKSTRLGKGAMTDVWEIEGIRSGEYEVYVKGAYSSGNGGSYWSGAQNVELNNDQQSNNGNPYNPGARYSVQIDTNDAVDLASEKTYADCGMVQAKDDGAWTNVAMAKVMVPEGSTSFTLKNNNNGYSIWVYAVRIVRVGNWTKPTTPAAFTDGVMRVEAESYHLASADPTIKTEDGATFIDHVGGWPQFNASYKISFAEAVHVKLKLRYNWYSQQWGNFGAAEFTLDGSNSKIKDANGQDNLAQSNDGPTNAWAETESAEFDLAAGEHTFKLQTPGGCVVSWDYFELIIVA